MPSLPQWKEIRNYPVIIGIGLLATGVTIAWWAGADVSPLSHWLQDASTDHDESLHSQIAFNLYWLWVLGTTVERVYGHFRTTLLILLFALGSSSLDFAFAPGGVGLSGVGYGLFGLLFVVSEHDTRFKDSLDKRTVNLFIAWFFICIFTTATYLFNVANVAHAAGAVLGLLLGDALVLPARRTAIAGTIGALVLFGFCGASFGRPFVNFSSYGGYEGAHWGYDALMATRNEEAIHWYRDAVKYKPKVSSFWFNLGIAYQRSNEQAAASSAYQRAYDLEPSKPEYAEAAGKEIRCTGRALVKKPASRDCNDNQFHQPSGRV